MPRCLVGLREPRRAYALISRCATVKRAVIFVHGFNGDSVTTWLQFQPFMDADTPPDVAAWWNESDAFFFHYDSLRLSIPEHASSLLDFVAAVFPRSADLVNDVSEEVRRALDPQFRDAHDVSVRAALASRVYEELIFVGHSLGGVIIREAVCQAVACRINSKDIDSGTESLMDAHLRLFAPAIAGVSPSNLLGLVTCSFQQVPLLGKWLQPVLSTNTMLRQLAANKERLKAIQERTEEYATSFKRRGFVAHVVFGEHESLVERDIYRYDQVASPVPHRDHWSVCKPDDSYRYPLEFVTYGRQLARRA